jgi:peptidoglycan/LPS O-acetylase OafA/YrhL
MAIVCGLWRIADAQNHFTDSWLGSVPTHFRTDLRLDALMWGCVTAFLLHDQRTREQLIRGLKPKWFALMCAIAVVGMVLYSQLASLWLAMLFPLMLSATLLHPQWTVSRWLEHPVMRFLGRMSYSLYLWQQLFLTAGWEHPRAFQLFPWNLMLVFCCAFASYRLVERPCMNLGRRLSERWRDAHAKRAESLAAPQDRAFSTLQ